MAHGISLGHVRSMVALQPRPPPPAPSQTPEAMMAMKTKEIAHCRLAMIAITGMFFQEAVLGSVWPIM